MWDSPPPPSSSRSPASWWWLTGGAVLLAVVGFYARSQLLDRPVPPTGNAQDAGAYLVLALGPSGEHAFAPERDCLMLHAAAGAQVFYSEAGARVRGDLSAHLWRLLTTARPHRERQIAGGSDDFGLTACRLRVRWGRLGQPAHTLCFGDDAPGEQIYARLETEAAPTPNLPRCSASLSGATSASPPRPPQTIHVFDRELFAELAQALTNYRELHPLPWSAQSVRRLEFSDGSLALRQEAGWFDEQGIPLSATAVHTLLAELGRDAMTPSDPTASDDAAPPAGKTLRVDSLTGESLRLTLRGLRVERDREPPLVLTPDRLRPWMLSARDLRDRRLLTLEPTTIDQLSLDGQPLGPDQPAQRVERRPQGFVLVSPVAGIADEPTLRALLQTLGTLQAESESPPAPISPTDGPHLLLRLRGAGREQQITLTSPSATGCSALLSAPSRRLALARSDCQRLWPLLTTPWLSHNLLLLDDARLTEVTTQCGQAVASLTRRDDRWSQGGRTLAAEEWRQRLRDLHALARADRVRYDQGSGTAPAAVRCTLRVRHAPLASLAGPGVLAPDSAPVEQCLLLRTDGWLRGCDGRAEYALTTHDRAALSRFLP